MTQNQIVLSRPDHKLRFQGTLELTPQKVGTLPKRDTSIDIERFLTQHWIEVHPSLLPQLPDNCSFPNNATEQIYVAYKLQCINYSNTSFRQAREEAAILSNCGPFYLSTFDEIAWTLSQQHDGRVGLLQTDGTWYAFNIQGVGGHTVIYTYFSERNHKWVLTGAHRWTHPYPRNLPKSIHLLFPVLERQDSQPSDTQTSTITPRSQWGVLRDWFNKRWWDSADKYYRPTETIRIPGNGGTHCRPLLLQLPGLCIDDQARAILIKPIAIINDASDSRHLVRLHVEDKVSFDQLLMKLPEGSMVTPDDVVFMFLRMLQKHVWYDQHANSDVCVSFPITTGEGGLVVITITGRKRIIGYDWIIETRDSRKLVYRPREYASVIVRGDGYTQHRCPWTIENTDYTN